MLHLAVEEHWSTRKLRKELASYFQAKIVQKGISGSVVAMKDVIDRHEGQSCRRVTRASDSRKVTKEDLVEMVYKFLNEETVPGNELIGTLADTASLQQKEKAG